MAAGSSISGAGAGLDHIKTHASAGSPLRRGPHHGNGVSMAVQITSQTSSNILQRKNSTFSV
ncbi:MAG: hypothetical protein ACI8YB_001338 [Patiriisocius sp.]|jgi:hypothetical protein